MNDPESDFDIPVAASTPPVAAEPVKPAVVARPNLVAAAGLPEPKPEPAAQELTPPSDFRSALALVQKIQHQLESMPNTTIADQRARWAMAQNLEQAKIWAKRLQQLPEPPPIHMSAASLMTVDQKVRLEPVDGIRAEVLARLKARSH